MPQAVGPGGWLNVLMSTSMVPLPPGGIGSFAHRGLRQPQLALPSRISTACLPALTNSNLRDKDTPLYTVPASTVVWANWSCAGAVDAAASSIPNASAERCLMELLRSTNKRDGVTFCHLETQ